MTQKFTIAIVFTSLLLTATRMSAAGCSADYSYESADPTIYFYEAAAGSITGYYWNFGDGSYSSEPDPVHTYSSSGSYNVCLTVYGIDGSDSCVDMFCQTVEIDSAIFDCEANYVYSLSGMSAYFTNMSSTGGALTDYFWDFGDGTYAYSEDVTHIFDEGIYNVCMSIFTEDSCTDTYCSTLYIYDSIPDIDSLCFASYDIESFSGSEFSFMSTSDGGGGDIVAYHWDFGDGEYSTLEDPEHTYDSPGSYIVCLWIITEDSCTSEACDSVSVSTGIKDLKNAGHFTVYPNPAKTDVAIHIENSTKDDEYIVITDMAGKTVMQLKTAGNETIHADVSALSEGIYFVSLSTEYGNIQYEKIVIVR